MNIKNTSIVSWKGIYNLVQNSENIIYIKRIVLKVWSNIELKKIVYYFTGDVINLSVYMDEYKILGSLIYSFGST